MDRLLICAVSLLLLSSGADSRAKGTSKSSKAITKTLSNSNHIATTDELIQYHGYDPEVHQVTTEDGYILTVFRIPNPGQQPVLILHGVFDTSDMFVLTNSSNNLAFILADSGYDVWIGNQRGNAYANDHLTLSPSEKEFWNFSMHEIGVYDIPATIDYILANTGSKQIIFIGHSLTTELFLIAASVRPEYNGKIKCAALLGPPEMTEDKTHWTLSRITLFNLFNASLNTLESKGVRRIPPIKPKNLHPQWYAEREFSLWLTKLIMGNHEDNWDEFAIEESCLHYPSTSSLKNVKQAFQIYTTGKFAMYDYGPTENFISYGTTEPPLYNLTNVKAPVALFIGLKDKVTNYREPDTFTDYFPNVVMKLLVQNYTHVDFMWGKDCREAYVNQIIDFFRQI